MGRYRWLILAAAALLTLPAVAADDHPSLDATGKFAGDYVCYPEASAGLSYDKTQKRWLPESWGAGGLIRFGIEHRGVHEIPDGDRMVAVASYRMRVTIQGGNPKTCDSLDPEFYIEKSGHAECYLPDGQFIYYSITTRFLWFWTGGSGGWSPEVTTGKCTKN